MALYYKGEKIMSDQTNNQPVQEEPSLSELLQVRRDKLAALREQGQDPFVITKFDVTHHSDEIKNRFEEMEGQAVRLAGRLMSKRGMGKAVFSDLQDGAGGGGGICNEAAAGEGREAGHRQRDHPGKYRGRTASGPGTVPSGETNMWSSKKRFSEATVICIRSRPRQGTSLMYRK